MSKRVINDFLIFGFASYGVIWTLVESASHFLKFETKDLYLYGLIILISCVIGIWRSWPKNSIEIQVPNSDSSIVIEFGDIFQHNGHIAITVNEYFDSELGDHVAPESLHGKFIRGILGSQSSAFDRLVDEALSNHPFDVQMRQTGKTKRYPIGTTAPVSIDSKKYFLFVLSHTNIKTLKANADIHDLWNSLTGLWESIRNFSNGQIVAIPLAGAGLSGVGIPPRNLLDIIVMSYFYYTKKNKIAKQVKVVLQSDLKSKIDLSTYYRNWN